MSIKIDGKTVIPYHGRYKPVNIYQGNKKVSGWRNEPKTSSSAFWNGTYDDRISGIITGNTVQAQSTMGKNIMDPGADFTYTQHGVTILKEGDIYSVLGITPSGLYPYRAVFTIRANSLTAGTYIFSKTLVSGGGSNPTLRLMDRTQQPAVTIVSTPPYSFVVSAEGHPELVFEVACNHNTSFNQTFRLQLERNTTATPYELFTPNKPTIEYPSPMLNAGNCIIRSANQDDIVSTNIALPELLKIGDTADTIEYKGSGIWELTKRIQKHSFTGNENWIKYTQPDTIYKNTFFAHLPLSILGNFTSLCNYFTNVSGTAPWGTTGTNASKVGVYADHGGQPYKYFNYYPNTTLEQFKNWVSSLHSAGTPLTVQYILATPVVTQHSLGELKTFPHYTSLTQSGNDTPAGLNLSAKIIDI